MSYQLHSEITEQILNAFFQVYNTLGYGFLERVYQNSLYTELIQRGFTCETEKPLNVYYKNNIVGNFKADIVVNNKVIVEIKSTESLHFQHEAQLTNYLKATEIEVGLLLNFGKSPEIRRKIFTNNFKNLS